MGIAYSARSYVLLAPGLWYAGRPIQISLKTVLGSIWVYFASAFLVGAFGLFIFQYSFILNDFLARLSLLSRIVIVAGIASFSYIALVVIIERSFRSLSEILSLSRLFFKRSES